MEKRKYHRYLLVVDIEHRIEGEDESHFCQSKDISQGGLCITTIAYPLEKDSCYAFNFTLPGELEPLQVKGRVVWVREAKSGGEKLYDNGIEFLGLGQELAKKIGEFSIGTVDH
ncbi:MAG: PilZ domain-containing protein [Spirochaetales bacterium]|nr:PilZ domain-containing protein [Spirochaetales bacterium]